MAFPQNQLPSFQRLVARCAPSKGRIADCILGNITDLHRGTGCESSRPSMATSGVKGQGGGEGCNFRPLPSLPHQDGAREGLHLHPSLLPEGSSMQRKEKPALGYASEVYCVPWRSPYDSSWAFYGGAHLHPD